jgi:uncharacterized membrane protein
VKLVKRWLHEIFIDAMSGMALGLFATLIIGTIIGQVGGFLEGDAKTYMTVIGNVAKTAMGAGIGVGVAGKLKASPLVLVSAAVAGIFGAFPGVAAMDGFVLGKPGEPLGAFVAALVAIKFGKLVAVRTKVDIIVTPLVCILSGAAAAFLVGPPISSFMTWLGNLVNFNVAAHPVIGGVIVSVLMGMILTLPISSAAIGVSMGISGLAAGAATIGCCCNMIGFAVASYKENKLGGLFAQGVGTSMLQVPNIMRKPMIWLPAIISSAILGPIASAVLGMVSTPVGSGMGTSGLVGQFAAYGAMTEAGDSPMKALVLIVVMHIVLPALLSGGIASFMRRKKLIKQGDMLLTI